jgi:hypothetical protein
MTFLRLLSEAGSSDHCATRDPVIGTADRRRIGSPPTTGVLMMADVLHEDQALRAALAALVRDGSLTGEQAAAVVAARAGVLRGGPTAAGGAVAPRRARGRLPEVVGYLGAALVLTAAVVAVGQQWRDLAVAGRFSVSALGAVLLLAAAAVVVRSSPGQPRSLRDGTDDARRRLAGVLVVLAAPLAAIALGVLLENAGVDRVLLPSAVLAAAVAAAAVAVAPGVVPTLGLAVSSLVTAFGVTDLFDAPGQLLVTVVLLVTALLWTVVTPRVTRTPNLALALGLLLAVGTGFAAASGDGHVVLEPGRGWLVPVGYATLAVLAVLGVVMFLSGRSWPWIGSAALSAAALVGTLADDALGPVAGVFIAGAVLLTLSAVLLRRRSTAPTPH